MVVKEVPGSLPTKTKGLGTKLSGTKVICIIIRSIPYQSRPMNVI